MNVKIRNPLVLATLLAGMVVLAPAPAGAIVPPKDCKTITVKGKRYNIKADQIKCTTARDYAEDYLRRRTVHRSWKCFRYSGSKLVFRCVNTRATPDKTIWAYKK